MKKDKIIKYVITALLILLPFLDMLRTTNIRHFEVFGISVVEIFNIILIGVAFILTLFKCNKKELLFVFGYLLLIIIYIVLHYKHIITFDIRIFKSANFNFKTETFYICRVYLLPLCLLFILIKNRNIFDKQFYFKIIKAVIIIISGSIIILNIFKLSYVSYSSNHNFNLYNMFDYFLFSGDFRQLSSRGWFDSANELSAVMLMLFPINIYLFYKDGKISNLILFIIQFIAMILLGTRTAAVGSVLIVILSLIIYFIMVVFDYEKINLKYLKIFLFVSLICTTFFSISPFMISRLAEGNADFSVKNAQAYDDINVKNKKNFSKLFEKYKSEYLINEEYLKIYPLKNDLDFWIKIASRNKALNNDSRGMKTDIIKRIKERNNNKIDTYLGMGYTLNMMDLERDYVYQYYIFGLIGSILLIGPYLAIVIYLFIKFFKKFNNNFNFETAMCFIGPLFGLLIAYYSGHVFGWVSPMMWLVVTLSLLFLIVSSNCDVNLKNFKKFRNNNKIFLNKFLNQLK